MKPKFLVLLLCGLAGAIACGATLSYSPAAPQTGDSALVISNKAAVAATTTATNTTTIATQATTAATQATTAATKLTTLLGGNSYSNITTATTTAVKSGSGVLERIVINTGGSGSTATIYDNTAGSGTKIATVSTASQATLQYNVAFTTGLTVVTASGTPADITVSYR